MDIEKIKSDTDDLSRVFTINYFKKGVRIPRNWTGLDEPFGSGTIFNTIYCRVQICTCLAYQAPDILDEIQPMLASGNKLYNDEDVITEQHKDSLIKCFDKLVKEQRLKQLRVLDLGCGIKPSFSRLARNFGATVYTVDVIPSSEFVLDYNNEDNKMREIEKKHHIQTDLNHQEAISKILEKTQGGFHIITSAHLFSGSNYYGLHYDTPSDINRVIHPLLLEDGILQNGGMGHNIYEKNQCKSIEKKPEKNMNRRGYAW
jgi:hypothetical protein